MSTRSNENLFVHPNNVETLVYDWGTIKFLSEPHMGSLEAFSTGMVIIKPGKGHERHNHPNSEEIIYFISGEGDQMVEDELSNPITQKLTAGSMVRIPTGRFHATLNTGWEPLRLLVVYSPTGPEQDMRSIPGTRIVPAGNFPNKRYT